MKRTILLAIVICSIAVAASAQAPRAKVGSTVFVQPTDDGFQTYITAAILKKKVPVSVVTNPELATYKLVAAQLEVEQVTTGHKVVNCLFAYCAGNQNKASTSVTLTDNTGIVIWSYAVNKGRGSKNRQSMAEAIAKHLGDHLKGKE